MAIAEETSKLSSAKRLQVGCIAVKNGRIIAEGYNGTPSGWDNNCEYEIDGKLVTKDETIHSEINLICKLAKSTDSSHGATVFITHSPCMECSKAIYQSGIETVIYKNKFRSEDGINFLKKCNVNVLNYSEVVNV